MGFMEFVPGISKAVGAFVGGAGRRQLEKDHYKNNVEQAKASSSQQAPGRGIMSGIFQAHGIVSPEQRKAMSAAPPIPQFVPSSNLMTDAATAIEGFGSSFPQGAAPEPFNSDTFASANAGWGDPGDAPYVPEAFDGGDDLMTYVEELLKRPGGR